MSNNSSLQVISGTTAATLVGSTVVTSGVVQTMSSVTTTMQSTTSTTTVHSSSTVSSSTSSNQITKSHTFNQESSSLSVASQSVSIATRSINVANITVVAGSDQSGCVDAVGSSAQFHCPEGICQLDADSIVIADRFNNLVRKIQLSTATASTLIGSGSNDASTLDSSVAVPASKAKLFSPSSVCVDPTHPGNVFVSTDELQKCIRQYSPADQTVRIVAGRFSGDESVPEKVTVSENGTEALLSDIACMTSGVLAGSSEPLVYFTSMQQHVVSSYNPRTHEVRLVVGTGERGSSSEGRLSDPYGLAIDSVGRLVIGCLEGYQIVRFDPLRGSLEVLAGQYEVSGLVDGDGKSVALLGDVTGLSIDEADNIYFCDLANRAIRVLSAADQIVSTLVSKYGTFDSTKFIFDSPTSILFDRFNTSAGNRNLFVVDFHRLIRIQLNVPAPAPTQVVAAVAPAITLVEVPSQQPLLAAAPQIEVVQAPAVEISPPAIQFARSNSFSLQNNLIRATGVRVVAGDLHHGFLDGALELSRFHFPHNICQPDADTLLIPDRLNHRVRKLNLQSSVVSTIAGCGSSDDARLDGSILMAALSAQIISPSCLCVDPSHSDCILIGTDAQVSNIRSLSSSEQTVVTVAGQVTPFTPPAESDPEYQDWVDACSEPVSVGLESFLSEVVNMHVAKLNVDSEPLVYFTSPQVQAIRSFNPRTFEIRQVLGNNTATLFGDSIHFDPFGIVSDSKGRLIISSMAGSQILRYDPSTTQMEVLAGKPAKFGVVDGKSQALLGDVGGVTIGTDDTVFFCEISTGAIRAISPEGVVYTLISPDSDFSSVAFGFRSPSSLLFDKFAAARGAPRLFVVDFHRILEIQLDPSTVPAVVVSLPEQDPVKAQIALMQRALETKHMSLLEQAMALSSTVPFSAEIDSLWWQCRRVWTEQQSVVSVKSQVKTVQQVSKSANSSVRVMQDTLKNALTSCDIAAIEGVLSSVAHSSAHDSVVVTEEFSSLIVEAKTTVTTIRKAQEDAVTGLQRAIESRDLNGLECALLVAESCSGTWNGSSSKLSVHPVGEICPICGISHHGDFEFTVVSSSVLTNLCNEARKLVVELRAERVAIISSLKQAIVLQSVTALETALSQVQTVSKNEELVVVSQEAQELLNSMLAEQKDAITSLETAILLRQWDLLQSSLTLVAKTRARNSQIEALVSVVHILIREITEQQQHCISVIRSAIASGDLTQLVSTVAECGKVPTCPELELIRTEANALIITWTERQTIIIERLRIAIQENELYLLETALADAHSFSSSSQIIQNLVSDVLMQIQHLRTLQLTEVHVVKTVEVVAEGQHSVAPAVKVLPPSEEDEDNSRKGFSAPETHINLPVDEPESTQASKAFTSPDTHVNLPSEVPDADTFSKKALTSPETHVNLPAETADAVTTQEVVAAPAPQIKIDEPRDSIDVPVVTAIDVIAGNVEPGLVDAVHLNARFNCPVGLTQYDENMLYVADRFNNRIRSLNVSTRAVNCVAGAEVDLSSPADGKSPIPADKAAIFSPSSVCVNPSTTGQLMFCTDQFQRVIRSISLSTSQVSYVCGQVEGVHADDLTPAKQAEMLRASMVPSSTADQAVLTDIATMIAGKLNDSAVPLIYFTCMDAHAVMSLNPNTYEVKVVVGNGERGPLSNGQLADPYGLAIDSQGRLIISGLESCQIVRYDPSMPAGYQLSLLAGRSGEVGFIDGHATQHAVLGEVAGLAIDEADNIYFCDIGNRAIRVLTASGHVRSLLWRNQNARGVKFDLKFPASIVYDRYSLRAGAPRLFVSDLHCVLQVSLDMVTTSLDLLALSIDRYVRVEETTVTVTDAQQENTSETFTKVTTRTHWIGPPSLDRVVATDVRVLAGSLHAGYANITGTGEVLAPDHDESTIDEQLQELEYYCSHRRTTKQALSEFAAEHGAAPVLQSQQSLVAQMPASFKFPQSLCQPDANTVYIADRCNNRIRRFDLLTGALTTIAGCGADDHEIHGMDQANSNPIAAQSARLYSPSSICSDPLDPSALLIGCDDEFQKCVRRLSNRKVEWIAGQTKDTLSPAEAVAADLLPVCSGKQASFAGLASIIYAQLAGDVEPMIYVSNVASHTVRSIHPRTNEVRLVLSGSDLVDGAYPLRDPFGLAVDSKGRLLITSLEGYQILRYDPNGTTAADRLHSIAGRASVFGFADGVGKSALMGDVSGICCDTMDTVYFCDLGANALRAWSPKHNSVYTIICHEPNYSGIAFELESPTAVLFDRFAAERGQPRLLVADFHRLIEISLDPITFLPPGSMPQDTEVVEISSVKAISLENVPTQSSAGETRLIAESFEHADKAIMVDSSSAAFSVAPIDTGLPRVRSVKFASVDEALQSQGRSRVTTPVSDSTPFHVGSESDWPKRYAAPPSDIVADLRALEAYVHARHADSALASGPVVRPVDMQRVRSASQPTTPIESELPMSPASIQSPVAMASTLTFLLNSVNKQSTSQSSAQKTPQTNYALKSVASAAKTVMMTPADQAFAQSESSPVIDPEYLVPALGPRRLEPIYEAQSTQASPAALVIHHSMFSPSPEMRPIDTRSVVQRSDEDIDAKLDSMRMILSAADAAEQIRAMERVRLSQLSQSQSPAITNIIASPAKIQDNSEQDAKVVAAQAALERMALEAQFAAESPMKQSPLRASPFESPAKGNAAPQSSHGSSLPTGNLAPFFADEKARHVDLLSLSHAVQQQEQEQLQRKKQSRTRDRMMAVAGLSSPIKRAPATAVTASSAAATEAAEPKIEVSKSVPFKRQAMPRTKSVFQQVAIRPSSSMFVNGPMAQMGLRIDQGPLSGLGVPSGTAM